ncbi:MAG: sigma-E factor negative regulatory protein [Pseudomonadota bacterium]
MSDNLRESLSALMDDETNELELHRLLAQIGNDAELRATWSRYNAVRTTLAGQAAAPLSLDISDRVREAIDGEQEDATPGKFAAITRPFASLAVAASVMGAVVFGGQQLAYLDDSGQPGAAVAASASPVGLVNSLGATSVQASFGTQALPGLKPATRTAYRELCRQRMKSYMEEHAEHAALNTPQGLLSYSRVHRISE